MHRSTDGFRPCLSADSARRLKNEKNGGGGESMRKPLPDVAISGGVSDRFF